MKHGVYQSGAQKLTVYRRWPKKNEKKTNKKELKQKSVEQKNRFK